MAFTPLKRRWNKKPPAGAAKVDWSHPSTKGLAGCFVFQQGRLVDLVDGSVGTNVGGLPSTVTREGFVYRGDNTIGERLNFGAKDRYSAVNDQISVFVKAQNITALTAHQLIGKYEDTSPFTGEYALSINSAQKLAFQVLDDSPTRRAYASTTSVVTLDGSYGGTFDGGNVDEGVTVYNNGVAVPVDYLNQDGLYDNMANRGSALTIAGHLEDDITFNGSLGGDISVAYVWTRELSPHEMKSLNDNPYQILTPYTQYIDMTIPAVGGATGKSNPLMGPLGGPLYGAIS